MDEDIKSILIYLGALILAWIILYLLCRTFWTRTIITIIASIAAMVMFLKADLMMSGICYFIAYFFLFGSSFAEKDGTYDVDLDNRRATANTKTIGIIVGSIFLALLSLTLSDLHMAVAIILPLLIVLFKVIRIINHIRYREVEFDSYEDDSDPDSFSF